MIRQGSIALVFMLWAASVQSQVRIETGDHDEFTRMAVYLPAETEWDVVATDAGIQVQITGSKFSPIGSFFDIISRDRIAEAEVQQSATVLDVSIACQCSTRIEQWRPNWLLIDIVDQVVASSKPITDQLDLVPIGLEPPSYEESERLSEAAPESAVKADVPSLSLPIVIERVEDVDAETPALFPQQFNPTNGGVAIPEFERAIRQSLSRALEQGLVQAVPQVGLQLQEINDLAGTIEASSGSLPGLSAQTSFEDARVLQVESPPVNELACTSDRELDFSRWGDDRPFHEQIAENRQKIVGEFDLPNSDAVEDLARTYLYFGFGKEAKSALRIDGLNSSRRTMLITLAEILDDEPVSDVDFKRQVTCETRSAMWALIATGGEIEGGSHGPIETMVLSFKGLPPGLQATLGPRFSAALRNVGGVEFAMSALSRSIDRPENPTELTIETANIALDRGNLEAATATLSQLAERNQRMTPDAILNLLASQMSAGDEIDDDTLSLLETMRFEFKNEAISDQLDIMAIQAKIYKQAFQSAKVDLQKVEDALTATEVTKLLNALQEGVVEAASDEVFLGFAFDDASLSAPTAIRYLFATRLKELGFYPRALELLPKDRDPVIEENYRLLRSEIEMAVAQQTATLEPAVNSSVPALVETSSEAYPRDPELQQSWRSGEWPTLQQSQDTLLKDAATRRLASSPTNPVGRASIREATDLVDDTVALRATVAQLLNRFEAPEIEFE